MCYTRNVKKWIILFCKKLVQGGFMRFIKTKTDFPSYVHKVIYLNALRQTPIEKSLAYVEGIDSILIESCREYFSFIMDMHSDMYDDPVVWGMNPGEYDEFLGKRKEKDMRQKLPVPASEDNLNKTDSFISNERESAVS
jgi:hypothetical protein